MTDTLRRRRLLAATTFLPLASTWSPCSRAAGSGLLAALGSLRLIVPTLAGGTLDLLGRVVAQTLAQQHRLAMAVLNVEGAAGEIALRRLHAEPPDGRTWLLAQESLLTINPSLYARGSTDVLDGLVPVARIATSNFYLLARAEDPILSLRDLLQEGRRTPSALPYGSGGVGTLHHLSMEAVAAGLDLKLLHVPYKGNAQAVQALARGDIRLLMAGSSALPLVDSGRLRVLAVTAPSRLAHFAEVPAIAEWMPGFQATNWFGIFGRKAVPDIVVAELRVLLQMVLDSEEVRRQLKDKGQVETGFLAGRQFIDLIVEDRQRYAGIVRRLALPAAQ